MNCPNCGSENRYDAVNCEKCGASMTENVEFTEDKASNSSKPATSEKMRGMVSEAGRRLKNGGKKGSRFFSRIWNKIKARFVDLFDGKDGEGGLKQRTKAAYDDVMSDTKKQKIALGIAAGIVLIIILIIAAGFGCGACACGSQSLAGTWVRAEDIDDGYSNADTVIVFDEEGKIFSNGFENGSYIYSEGVLDVSYNGMEFSARTEENAQELYLYLFGSDFAGMELVKLSDETELTSSQISDLYPNN